MIEITCSGTPYEIGHEHGRSARTEVLGGIAFYSDYFLKKSKFEWSEACAVAEKFLPKLNRDWPHYVEEMRGIADGAQVPFESILAMNVRTEIALGMMSDGCTCLAWKHEGQSFVAQNWDWELAHSKNLIIQHIEQKGKPSIRQVAEAGILGKVGLNSAGVGMVVNAIRCKGVDFERLPCNLAFRAVLDSTSRQEAVELLEREGICTAIHILIADATGSTSIESSPNDVVRIESRDGRLAHTNHYLRPHAITSKQAIFLPDSHVRMDRVTELLHQDSDEAGPSKASIQNILLDEFNYPFSINRAATEEITTATLFSIVMDVVLRKAWVKIGRPSEPEREFHFAFD